MSRSVVRNVIDARTLLLCIELNIVRHCLLCRSEVASELNEWTKSKCAYRDRSAKVCPQKI